MYKYVRETVMEESWGLHVFGASLTHLNEAHGATMITWGLLATLAVSFWSDYKHSI